MLNQRKCILFRNVSPIEASKASFLQLNLPLNLTGRDVNVAIIDTGIDYLNEEFMKPNGETRIELIWDQTIISSKEYQSNSSSIWNYIYKK